MKSILFFMVVFSWFVISGCGILDDDSDDEINGSDTIITQTREPANIIEISVSGQADVYYTQSENPELRIEANDNVIDKVITSVTGDRLTISLDKNYSYNDIDITVHVSTPDLTLLHNTGQANFFSVGTVLLDSLKLHCVGQANYTLSGEVSEQFIVVEGQSNVFNYNLHSEECYVSVAGQANIQVYATALLDVFIAGQATVSYDGNPTEVNQNISGVGTVQARN